MKVLSLFALGLASHLTFAASYAVPVPSELAKDAIYHNINATSQLKNQMLTVEYDLPVGLVGTNYGTLRFTGEAKSSFIPVAGDGVFGVCMPSQGKPTTCMLRYPEMTIDTDSRDEALKSLYQGDELNRRMAVGRLFKEDPAGILFLE